MEKGDIEFESVIKTIERERKQAMLDRQEAAKLALEAKKRDEESKKEQEAFREKEEEIIRKAKEEARDILRDARRTADDVGRELRRINKMASVSDMNRSYDRSRRKLNSQKANMPKNSFSEPIRNR